MPSQLLYCKVQTLQVVQLLKIPTTVQPLWVRILQQWEGKHLLGGGHVQKNQTHVAIGYNRLGVRGRETGQKTHVGESQSIKSKLQMINWRLVYEHKWVKKRWVKKKHSVHHGKLPAVWVYYSITKGGFTWSTITIRVIKEKSFEPNP